MVAGVEYGDHVAAPGGGALGVLLCGLEPGEGLLVQLQLGQVAQGRLDLLDVDVARASESLVERPGGDDGRDGY